MFECDGVFVEHFNMDEVLYLYRIRNSGIYGEENTDEETKICSYSENCIGKEGSSWLPSPRRLSYSF